MPREVTEVMSQRSKFRMAILSHITADQAHCSKSTRIVILLDCLCDFTVPFLLEWPWMFSKSTPIKAQRPAAGRSCLLTTARLSSLLCAARGGRTGRRRRPVSRSIAARAAGVTDRSTGRTGTGTGRHYWSSPYARSLGPVWQLSVGHHADG